jgi:hypothetical protein
MSSFLSPTEIAICSGLHDQLHETYGRPLTLFKSDIETQIFSDPNYNAAYRPSVNNLNVQLTPVSGVFIGRIFYYDDAKLQELFATDVRADEGGAEARLQLAKGEVRVKLPIAALPFVSDMKKIILDNNSYIQLRDNRLHGPNGTLQFVSVFLQKTE